MRRKLWSQRACCSRAFAAARPSARALSKGCISYLWNAFYFAWLRNLDAYSLRSKAGRAEFAEEVYLGSARSTCAVFFCAPVPHSLVFD